MINIFSGSRIVLIGLYFSLLACDSSSLSNADTDLGSPPSFSSPTQIFVTENSTGILSVTASDADNDALIFSVNGGADQSLFNLSSNGMLSFIAPPDYENPSDSDNNNSYLIQISVSDGSYKIQQTVSIYVTNVNEFAPVLTAPTTVNISENNAYVVTLVADDGDDDSLSYSLLSGDDDALFLINSSTGVITFNSAPDYETPLDFDTNNSYQFTVSVSDGLLTTSQSITVNVSNDANEFSPVFTSETAFTVTENNAQVSTVTAIDGDADIPSFSITGGADQALLNINSSGLLSFNAPADFEAPGDQDSNNIYLIQVAASDGINTTNQTISITVSNQNDVAPVITSGNSFSVVENTSTVTMVSATDADDNTVNFAIIGGVDQAVFSINNNALIFNSAPDYEAPSDNGADNNYIVQISANDGVHTTNQTITVNVTDVNEAAFGLNVRPTNVACSFPEPPPAATSITLARVFNSLSFNKPVALRQSPTNADRWYVLEQEGVIRTFLTGDSNSTVFADLTRLVNYYGEQGLLGIAFHPDFVNNNYLFLYYSANRSNPDSSHESRVSRFTLSSETQLNIDSEQLILRVDQPRSNHNGGNILFGPDGYLYIGLGDGGGSGDPNDNAQDINTMLGKMLRIDVDNPAGGNLYSSPASNPYVGVSGADEIYALGLRNPWRWSFDRVSGQLIAGDVGQGNWEEIDIITKGGNYGWRCYEGDATFNTSSGCNDTYIPPIYDYGHDVGFSVTGGYVYRGNAIPSLIGRYVFSDYGPGPIWVMADPYGTPSVSELINDTTTSATFVSSFAEDNNGELYVMSFTDGNIYRIESAVGGGGNFPTLLSETGCVNPADPKQMAEGVIPYDINAPFWSDGVVKDRWFAIPDASTITIESNGDWSFPDNSVTIKNFRLNSKLVETRFLVKHNNGSWAGYSYEWNDTETDASLVLNGKTKTIDGQSYIYPSSAQCMLCHTQVSGFALGPETQQLNRDKTYTSTGITANQLSTLDHIGMFSLPLADPGGLTKLTTPDDLSAGLQDRARSYLYTNCAQCHRQGGPTNAALDFNITTVNADMNVCNVAPSYNIGNANYLLSPGDANDSSLYHRMSCRTGEAGCDPDDQMPPIGSTVVDSVGASLLSDWINSLINCQ